MSCYCLCGWMFLPSLSKRTFFLTAQAEKKFGKQRELRGAFVRSMPIHKSIVMHRVNSEFESNKHKLGCVPVWIV